MGTIDLFIFNRSGSFVVVSKILETIGYDIWIGSRLIGRKFWNTRRRDPMQDLQGITFPYRIQITIKDGITQY